MMKHFKLVVLSNPAEGREDEYNDWYTNTHLADVLRVPGIVRAQRLRRTEQQRDASPQPWKYLAIYECEAPDVQLVIDGLRARSGSPEMPISSAMADVRYVCYFEPITEMVSAKS
jgi:hypothetical protein